ncbi:heavy metal-associated isoprenylated plant protein 4 [Aristolochia californica]|uniref:heavy metal-associated isoprenylated plant protein 4 n=1 Tax=Aristolochia californica TaxID=171875 RepID=UPI0035E31D9D
MDCGADRDEVINIAIYRVNLHCRHCAYEIEMHLRRTQGVQKVEVDIESGKVSVRGKLDSMKVHELIEKTTNTKVELISLLSSKHGNREIIKKETEELAVSTTVIKVPMHCKKCEYDVKRRLLKLKGVHSVRIDSKRQTCTVDSTAEGHQLREYFWKKMHKHVEVVSQTRQVRKEKEEYVNEVGIKQNVVTFCRVEGKEQREELKCDGLATVPCFVHHAYAPQLFSDENPNACRVM